MSCWTDSHAIREQRRHAVVGTKSHASRIGPHPEAHHWCSALRTASRASARSASLSPCPGTSTAGSTAALGRSRRIRAAVARDQLQPPALPEWPQQPV